MKNKAFYFQIQVKDVTTEQNSTSVFIEGFASTPDVDRYQDIVQPTAFKDALEMYMKNPVMLFQHDPNRPIGNVLSATVTEKGLQIRAEIKDEETAKMVQDGRMRAMSIGYIPLQSTLQHEDGSAFNAEKDSVWDSSLIRVIEKLDLVEISIVSTPANGNALFTVAKSVKSYFNEMVATKSFSLSKKDGESEQTEQKPVEPVVLAEPAAKPQEENQPAQPAAETAVSAEEVVKQEEAEKATETVVTDGGEAPNKGEEPKADAEPMKPADPAPSADEVKGLVFSKKTAELLPELVEAGLAKVDEEKSAADLPEGLVNFMRKLIEQSAVQFKRAEDLQVKLDNMPAKQALAPSGQFGAGGEENTSAKKEPSDWFKKMFNIQ